MQGLTSRLFPQEMNYHFTIVLRIVSRQKPVLDSVINPEHVNYWERLATLYQMLNPCTSRNIVSYTC